MSPLSKLTVVDRKLALHRRQGIAAIEGGLVMLAFFTLIFGMLDFGIAVLNRNNLAAAAHRAGRAAIIHGQKSTPELAAWGPTTMEVTANSGGELANAVAPFLALMPANKVQIRLEWPDGDNAPGQRVRATVTYQQQLICRQLFARSPWSMQAVAVMRIQH